MMSKTQYSHFANYKVGVLLQYSVPEGDLHCQCILSIFTASVHQFYVNILVFININPFFYINDQFALGFTRHFTQYVLRSKVFFNNGRPQSGPNHTSISDRAIRKQKVNHIQKFGESSGIITCRFITHIVLEF